MLKHLIATLILSLACLSLVVAKQKNTDSNFTFKSRQAIYVVAVRGESEDPTSFSPDPKLESHIKEQFRKEGIFKLAPSPAEADLIFLAISRYTPVEMEEVRSELRTSALSLILLPPDYAQYQTDFTGLRHAAIWRQERKARRNVTEKSLVQDFNQQMRTLAATQTQAQP